jgi:hypothetical protein
MEGNQAGIAGFCRLFPVFSDAFAHISAHNRGIKYHRMQGPEGKVKRFLQYATLSSIEFHLKFFFNTVYETVLKRLVFKIFVGKHNKQGDEYVIGRSLSLVSSLRRK